MTIEQARCVILPTEDEPAVPLAPTFTPGAARANAPVGWLALALVLMLGLLVNNSYTSYRQAEAEGAVMTRNLVQVLESRLSSDFAQTSDALAFLARRVSAADLRPTLSTKQQAAISQQLADLEASFPDAGGLTLFDAEGILRHASNPSLKVISIADRPHFQKLRDDPQARIAFSDAQIARTTGKWSIVMARALRDERGRFFGTANAVIALDSISSLFESIDVGPGGVTLLRRSDTSRLIQRIPRNNEKDFNQPLPPNNPIRQRIEAGEHSGMLSLIASTDGIERLASFKTVENTPFYVQVAIAKDHYLASWKQGALSSAILALGLLCVFGFAIWSIQQSRSAAKKSARLIAYRQALFAGLFEQSGFLAGILDQTGHLIEVNQTALTVSGRRREEVLGKYFPDAPWWSPTEDRATLEGILRAAAQGTAGSFETTHAIPGGGEISVLFHALPVRAGDACYIAVTGIDITERKVAEQGLVRERRHLENILWGTGVGTWEWNVQTGETRFNERWAELVGYTLDELAPINIDTWMRLAHPDDLAASGTALEKHFAGTTDAYECESRMRHKDGHWIWVLDRGKLVSRTPDGQPEWMAGTHMEITARKQAEESLQQQTAALARSNAELEQFAYVASHDLRQPLRMVNSYVQLLERRLAATLDDETREMMHFATDGAKRMDQMLISLLEYSRVGRGGEPLAPLASHDAVAEALRFLDPAIREAHATVRVSGDWPQVLASRDEFTRLWQNLIGNAIKYRAPERAPEVDITVTPEAEGAREGEGDGEGWRFCVADNGIGIEPAQFDRLFKVFQRLHTRDQYEGSGIGLAVARKIVERHGGRIWVESGGDGQGCRFCFSLPALPAGVGS